MTDDARQLAAQEFDTAADELENCGAASAHHGAPFS